MADRLDSETQMFRMSVGESATPPGLFGFAAHSQAFLAEGEGKSILAI
jgi:hypothetical protein